MLRTLSLRQVKLLVRQTTCFRLDRRFRLCGSATLVELIYTALEINFGARDIPFTGCTAIHISCFVAQKSRDRHRERLSSNSLRSAVWSMDQC